MYAENSTQQSTFVCNHHGDCVITKSLTFRRSSSDLHFNSYQGDGVRVISDNFLIHKKMRCKSERTFPFYKPNQNLGSEGNSSV